MRDVATFRGYRRPPTRLWTPPGHGPESGEMTPAEPNVTARDWALPAAAALAALEAVAMMAALVRAGGAVAPLAIALLVVKLAFCIGLAARRAGAYLTIWLYEGAGGLAALLKPHLAATTRLLEVATAGACIALLVAG